MKTSYNEKYILHPHYGIRKNGNTLVLYNNEVPYDTDKDSALDDALLYIHPMYAFFLSLFDGNNTLKNCLDIASNIFNKPEQAIMKLVKKLILNKKGFNYSLDGKNYYLPKKLLIPKRDNHLLRNFNKQDYKISQTDLEVELWRLSTPLDIILVTNRDCYTDCSYCYADRETKKDSESLSYGRIKELVEEAKILQMRSFDVNGGEYFLYKHWEQLTALLIEKGFKPYISTKIPIDEKTIIKLKNLGINHMQISLDSIFDEELSLLLKTSTGYFLKMQKTISLLKKHEIKLTINSLITKHNQDKFTKLIDYAIGLEHLHKLGVSSVGYSNYKNNYSNLSPSLDKEKEIENYIENIKNQRHVNINMSGSRLKETFINSTNNKSKNFNERARCSGNFYALIILPNGDVTICEELYYEEKFILGNLKNNSILEIWNSPKAKNLYNIQQNSFSRESACYSCDIFDSCYREKGVCWLDKLFAYGPNNYDLPDPKCHLAPKPLNKFWVE